MPLVGIYIMQVGLFKKSKGSWLQDLFNELVNSPLLRKSIENTQRNMKNTFKIESKSQEKILHPPDVAFRLDSKLINKIKEKLERTRRNIQGIVVANSLESPIEDFMEFKMDNEDIGGAQELDGVFCVGLSLTKGEGDSEIARRIKQELRRCSDRSGLIYSHTSKHSYLSELSKVLIRQIRIFLLIDETKDALVIGKLMFYPKANIPLRKVKIQLSFTNNEVLENIKSLNFARDTKFGYISMNQTETGLKFILLDRNDPELQNNSFALLGVWAAGYLGNALQKEAALWSLIMDYLTDPQITKRLSLQGERSGLFFVFDSPRQSTLYMFQFPTSARWSISSQIETCNKIPEEYVFNQQEVIMQEEKEESEVESISSKQDKLKQGFDSQENIPEPSNNRIIQEKDAEIKRLKVELEFYKSQCEKLQQALNNMNVLQLASQTLSSNIFPAYRSNPQSNMEESYPSKSNDVPFFGKKSESELRDETYRQRLKEFTVKDMKNISFSQQQFEQEPLSSKIIDNHLLDFKFTTPEFKESREVKSIPPKDIKSFQFKKSQEKEESNFNPLKNSKVRTYEREEYKEKEKEKFSPESPKEKTTTSSIRNLEEKYENYKNFSRNSPKQPQKNSIIEREQRRGPQEYQVNREQMIKKASFAEEQRQKRIKNELYSQEKQSSPIKRQPQPLQPPKFKDLSQGKTQEHKQNRSKSPLPPKKPSPAIESDDQDDQLKNIIQKRGKKR